MAKKSYTRREQLMVVIIILLIIIVVYCGLFSGPGILYWPGNETIT
ncbi:MAG: hypothetical protein ACFFEE_04635 [Candidatus Thorarchaeota archaeon]